MLRLKNFFELNFTLEMVLKIFRKPNFRGVFVLIKNFEPKYRGEIGLEIFQKYNFKGEIGLEIFRKPYRRYLSPLLFSNSMSSFPFQILNQFLRPVCLYQRGSLLENPAPCGIFFAQIDGPVIVVPGVEGRP